MTFAYIRKRYGLDVRRGDAITVSGVRGWLTRCTKYLHIRFHGCRGRFHPLDNCLVFVSANERKAKATSPEVGS